MSDCRQTIRSRSNISAAGSRAAAFCLFLSPFLLPASGIAQERCGAAKDLTAQAIERIKTGSSQEVGDGLQLLKHANEMCITLGDAWYYRSLFERRLTQTAKADYSLRNAQKFGSEAMQENIDPFVVATDKPAPASTLPPGAVRTKWALVIGISRFNDPRVNRLNYPAKDAKDFADLLKDPAIGRFPPGNVKVLTDDQATLRQIKANLNWLARNAQPDDLVVVFISSHGSPRELDTRNVNYIITNDTQTRPQDDLFSTALGMYEVTQLVRSRILARRTVVLLDTCHSGAAAGGKGDPAERVGESSVSTDTLDTIRQGVGRAIITSSQVGEQSYEDDDDRNGYFTFFLIQALKKGKGQDSIDKVYAYVRDQVSKNVQAKYHSAQSPVMTRSDHGSEIVLGVTPTETVSASAATP
jgi:Caspase domain